MNEPKLSLAEAQAVVETKAHPRVTLASMAAKIKEVSYKRHAHMTICVVEMQSGFFVVGKAAPADPRNFDASVGERYAYEDAIKQLWQLEGYTLCTRLHEGW